MRSYNLNIPIYIGVLFSLSTFILFRFGVWDFPLRNNFYLTLYVIILNAFMYFGFRLGTSAKRFKLTNKKYDKKSQKVILNFVNIVVIVTIFTAIPRFIVQTGFYDFNFSFLIDRIIYGLTDASMAYSMNREKISIFGFWSYINIFLVLTGFMSYLFIPISIIFWHKLRRSVKYFFVFYIFLQIMQNLSRGTNFGVFDLLIQIAIFFLIRRYYLFPKSKKRKPIGKRKTWIYLLLLLIVLFAYFSNTMGTRVGDHYTRLLPMLGNNINIRSDSLIWNILPDSLKGSFATLNAYVSHGYVGLGLAFDIPFNSTFGLGNSWFTIMNFEEITGINLLEYTYHYKIYETFNYHYGGYWHTAYLWFANDVSLLLVPFVLFILMFVYGSAWKDFIINRNIFALLFMSTFVLFFTFISANNQVFSSSNSLFTFWVTLIIWKLTSRQQYFWNCI